MDFEKMVEKILAPYKFVDDLQPITGQSLRSDILTALRAAATVPEGMVRVGTEDVRLLGTLPVTADGCVVGFTATLWINNASQISSGIADMPGWSDSAEPECFWPFHDCYSTREAAEAARPKGGEGA